MADLVGSLQAVDHQHWRDDRGLNKIEALEDAIEEELEERDGQAV